MDDLGRRKHGDALQWEENSIREGLREGAEMVSPVLTVDIQMEMSTESELREELWLGMWTWEWLRWDLDKRDGVESIYKHRAVN